MTERDDAVGRLVEAAGKLATLVGPANVFRDIAGPVQALRIEVSEAIAAVEKERVDAHRNEVDAVLRLKADNARLREALKHICWHANPSCAGCNQAAALLAEKEREVGKEASDGWRILL